MCADQIRKGTLIALEGIDGSGTTTQARLLADWLDSAPPRDNAAHLTQEPSSGPIGLLLRDLLKDARGCPSSAMALLFAADRVDHLAREIEPKLASGVDVVTDRYVFSSLAYQSVADDLTWVAELNSRAPDADITIYLRVPAEIAETRRGRRGTEPEIYESIGLQRAIAQRYDEMLGRSPADGTWQHGASDGWVRCGPTRQLGGRDADVAVVDGQIPAAEVHVLVRSLALAVTRHRPATTELSHDDSP